jgi:hypothetical protein
MQPSQYELPFDRVCAGVSQTGWVVRPPAAEKRALRQAGLSPRLRKNDAHAQLVTSEIRQESADRALPCEGFRLEATEQRHSMRLLITCVMKHTSHVE